MLTSIKWQITPEYQKTKIAKMFATLPNTLKIAQGEIISQDTESEVRIICIQKRKFFLKRYFRHRGLRGWLGFSRIRGEWKNLLFFQSLNIPIPNIVAYGEEYFFSRSIRGALITEFVYNSSDLSQLYFKNSLWLKNRSWMLNIVKQLARATQIMHDQCFVHNDLKWRNILVILNEKQPNIYFIDCPCGQRMIWPFLYNRKIKDLACLDQLAKKCLSKTIRLRFYKLYVQTKYLSIKDKIYIKKILNYFNK